MPDMAAAAPMSIVDGSCSEQEHLAAHSETNEGAAEEALATRVLRAGRRLALVAAAAAGALVLGGTADHSGMQAHPFAGIPGLSAADAELLQKYDVTAFNKGIDKPWREQPEELGAIRTQCFIDPWQAMAYLGTAAAHIYRATICPDASPLGCTAPIDNTITALLWTGAFLATAASSCAETMNVRAACAAGVLKDLATSGSIVFGIEEDCFLTNVTDKQNRVFSGDQPEARRLRGMASLQRLIRQRVNGSDAGEVDRFRQSVRHRMNVSSKESLAEASERYVREARGHGGRQKASISARAGVGEELVRASLAGTERNFLDAMCAFDSMNAVGWLIRAFLWVRQAALHCKKPGICAVDAMSVLSSLSFASQFINYLFVDCPEVGSRPALCGKDISETIGSLILFGPSVLKTVDFCELAMKKDDETK